jgi:protein-S-isoprenylcysteine O-methyltransferase Ste14
MDDRGSFGRVPLGAAVGTLVFAPAFVAAVIGWGPYHLTRWHVGPPLLGWAPIRWVGAVLVVAAIPVVVDFCLRFVREGHGTPAPFAPPRRLVVSGPYRWVRNPGYVAAVTMIAGEALVLGSVAVLAYAALVWLACHALVVGYEEPTLLTTFGDDYAAYRRRVPRWVPRIPTAR